MRTQPNRHIKNGARHYRKQSELVNYPALEGWWFEKEYEWFFRKLIELSQRARHGFEHARCKHIRPFPFRNFSKVARQKLIGDPVIEAPQGSIRAILIRIFDCEV